MFEEEKKSTLATNQPAAYVLSSVQYQAAPSAAALAEISPPVAGAQATSAASSASSSSPTLTRQPSLEAPETGDVFLGVQRLPAGSVLLPREEKPLGAGAFGRVYKGVWQKRPVAIKEIDIERAQGNLGIERDQVLEALAWEVSRLSTTTHANLVQFYGIYEEEGKTYLVLEFCEGGNLQSALQKNPAWSKRWQWALQITQGLAYLHRQGVLHRDLKAENILLDKHCRARLADLGVAQVDALLQRKEASVVAQGLQDQRFKAPEAFQTNTSTQATDIYALGLVFWQLCTGKEPASVSKELLKQMRETGVRESISEDCPPIFKQLILDCWQADPIKRPTAEMIVQRLKEKEFEVLHSESFWVKALEQTESWIHPKRSEILKYIPPYLTSYKVEEDLDSFWQRWESASGLSGKGEVEEKSALEEKKIEVQRSGKEEAGSATSASEKKSPLLTLAQTFQAFLGEEQPSTLILLGDSGLGKSLSLYRWAEELLAQWWARLSGPIHSSKQPYFPVLVRPALARWSYSELQGAFEKTLQSLGVSLTIVRDIPWLVMIDGYDECQADVAPQNLPQLLGLNAYPKVKLLVTCRPDTVERSELRNRFAFNGRLTTRYFLPFNVKQLLSYLNDNLHWETKTHEQYQQKMQQARQLRAVLRNPFVLSLLVQSWETVSKKDFQHLNRFQIYEAFVEHWFNTQSNLLSNSLQNTLRGQHSHILEHFNHFVSEIAFTAFNQKGIFLKIASVPPAQMTTYWLDIEQQAQQDSRKIFQRRQQSLEAAQRRRVLLTEEDYLKITQGRVQQFLSAVPLKNRAGQLEFSHKSFFEYFMARRLLQLAPLSPEERLEQVLSLLNTRPIQQEPEVFAFMNDAGWPEPLKETFFQTLEYSKSNLASDQASANAATILNMARVPFSGRNFQGGRLPGADLSSSICDGTNFHGADLRGVNFQGAYLSRANFAKALMQDITFGELPTIRLDDAARSRSCCYSPDGQLLAVTSDKNIKLFEATSRRHLKTLKGHSDMVLSVAFSLDSRTLASGSGDKLVKLWSVAKGRCVQTLEGHSNWVISVAFSPDGQTIASGSKDETLKIWSVPEGRCVQTLEGHSEDVNSVAFSPDGCTVASGSNDNSLKLWSVSEGRCVQTLEGHSENVNSVAFSPDGRTLVSGSGRLDSRSKDNTLKLWLVSEGRCVQTFEGHSGSVASVAFSSDGCTLASGSGDRTIKLWLVSEGRCVQTFEGHSGSVESVAFSPDGCTLASGDYWTIKLWLVSEGRCVQTLEGHDRRVHSVAFSPDGHTLASGSDDRTIKLWSVAEGCCVQTFKGHSSQVNSIAFSPDGRTLASGSADNTIKLWSVAEGCCVQTFEGHIHWVTSVAFSPDGCTLASGSLDNTIKLWLVSEGRCVQTLWGLLVHSVAFSPDGRTLASGSNSETKTLKIWSVVEARCLQTFEHSGSVESVAFSPDGCTLVSGSGDKTLKLWSVADGRCVQTLKGHSEAVTSVAFDGRTLVSGSWDNTLKLWVQKGTIFKLGYSNQLFSRVDTITWHETSFGCFLATGHDNGAVCYWQVLRSQKGLCVQLQWSSRQLALEAQETNLGSAQGLSENNTDLLVERGAKGKPKVLSANTATSSSAATSSSSSAATFNEEKKTSTLFYQHKNPKSSTSKEDKAFSNSGEENTPSSTKSCCRIL